MLLIRMDKLAVGYAEKTLFTTDTLEIHRGEKIALVGANGSGKSTLLKLLDGTLDPLRGQLERRGYIARLPQIETIQESPDWQARAIWDVLDESHSGGERLREKLAFVFSTRADLLLLDEPTANLDREGIKLLEQSLRHLQSYLLVSHDRALLNAMTERTLAISEGRLLDFPGPYDAYKAWEEQDRERRRKEYTLYQEEKTRLLHVAEEQKRRAAATQRRPKNLSSSEIKARAFGAVGKSIGGKAKSLQRAAKNTERRLSKMEEKVLPKRDFVIRPDFSLTDPPQNKIVLEAQNLSFSYPGRAPLLKEIGFQLKRGQKHVLVGANGSGKSTLLKLIHEGYEGIRKVPKAKIGHFRQGMKSLDLEKTLLENIRESSRQNNEVNHHILARMGFFHERLGLRAGRLSGGEQMKLAFAKLFVSNVNVLLLDEPTNYLDLPSREAIESLILDYPGTCLIVSHDEALTNHLADEIWSLKEGKLSVLQTYDPV